ncbi:Rieske (2Fe-2S) protein [Acidihalobacter prosperus]|uniref:Iron-sulfur cluster-binding protein n=1 Tax=Acidihalobacter prosperus TaxID=160660 RepID=A0A1A6C192_9GAMM|nr:Rieske 2Fe-2S domain-containing protein [Acidihalobacter prosperus]OBS08319.1 Iron-sulfur cluster-binding protein [Acidihalobacter prosperus]
MNGRQPLLELESLPDPGSIALEIERHGQRLAIVVIRHQGHVHGYLNDCPHLGTPLDWVPGEVLDRDGQYIVCATHGARFRIHDGHCISGPCLGDRLTPVPLRVGNGRIYLDSPPDMPEE